MGIMNIQNEPMFDFVIGLNRLMEDCHQMQHHHHWIDHNLYNNGMTNCARIVMGIIWH